MVHGGSVGVLMSLFAAGTLWTDLPHFDVRSTTKVPVNGAAASALVAQARGVEDDDDDSRARFISGPLRLIASEFVNVPTQLVPADITVVETLESPVLVSLSVPADRKRNVLAFLFLGHHSWQQVVSLQRYRFDGGYRVSLASPVLPSATSFGFPIEGQRDSAPSDEQVFRDSHREAHAILTDRQIASNLQNSFPALTPDQALDLAHNLLHSEMTLSLTLRVTVRSVSVINVGGRRFEVLSD